MAISSFGKKLTILHVSHVPYNDGSGKFTAQVEFQAGNTNITLRQEGNGADAIRWTTQLVEALRQVEDWVIAPDDEALRLTSWAERGAQAEEDEHDH